MYPIIFKYGKFTIYSYGVCVACAFTISLLYLTYSLNKSKKKIFNENSLYSLCIHIMIISIIGSRLLYVIMNLRYFIINPLSIFKLWHGGLIYYGGFISSFVLFIIYSYKHKISMLQLCDFFAPGLALGHSIGRLGCLFSGCCYGKPSNVPWAIIFNNKYSMAILGKYLHPTQLYEAVMNFFIFIILCLYSKKKHKIGIVFGLYMFLYGIGRFITEFFRGDSIVSIMNYFSMAQIISIFISIFGVYVLCKKQ
jgi:phosphatidylglycerol:prolipoprotein diacylglycerol transferase